MQYKVLKFGLVSLLLVVVNVARAGTHTQEPHLAYKLEMESQSAESYEGDPEEEPEYDSNNYEEIGEVLAATPLPTPLPTGVPPTDTILYGKEADDFSAHGFVVRKAFPFSTDEPITRFNISNAKGTFSGVQTNEDKQTSVEMQVTGKGLYSYQILAQQFDVFKKADGQTIPNTLCDSVGTPCTSTLGRVWTAADASGFGYRMEGKDIAYDFFDQTVYRPFPLLQQNELAVPVMSGTAIEGTRQSTLFMKINLPPSYQEGTYTTDITLFAIPKL